MATAEDEALTPSERHVGKTRAGSVGDLVKAFESPVKEMPAWLEERQTVYVKLPGKSFAMPGKPLAMPRPASPLSKQKSWVAMPREQLQERRRKPKERASLELVPTPPTPPEGQLEIVPMRSARGNRPVVEPGYCINVPVCRIEIQDGWVRVALMFQDPCGFFAKIKDAVCEEPSVAEGDKRPRTRLQALQQGACRAAGSRGVQAAAVGAVSGAAALGAAGAVGGAAAGGSLGALAGLLAAPLTLGLSVPVGAALGSGTGLCAGAVACGTAGTVSGGMVGFLGYKCSGIPGAVLGRMGAKPPPAYSWGAGREQAEEREGLTLSK